jgi:hypothetical protein
MREGRASIVRIGRLRLRVPGATRDDGRGMAASVSGLLARMLPTKADQRVAGLQLRLPLDRASSARETPGVIASAIVSRLTGGSDG